jgi:hypothetical protein
MGNYLHVTFRRKYYSLWYFFMKVEVETTFRNQLHATCLVSINRGKIE